MAAHALRLRESAGAEWTLEIRVVGGLFFNFEAILIENIKILFFFAEKNLIDLCNLKN